MTIMESLTSLKVLVLLTVINVLIPRLAEAQSYGAYGNYTLGSARVLGLGGAYTAVSEDTNTFFYNPAGIALSELDFQFEASTNRLNNDELDLDHNGTGEMIPNQFELIGVHYRIGRLYVGLGYLMPYFAEIKNDFAFTSLRSLKIQEAALNLSYSLGKNWAIGINGKYASAIQIDVTDSLRKENKSVISYWQWGVVYKSNRWAAGYSFSPEVFWTKESVLNSSGIDPFLNVVTPQKQVVGISYYIKPDKIRLGIDLVSVKKIQNSFAFESSIYNNPQEIKEMDYTFPKFGIEFVLIKTNKTNAQFRVGYYEEPSRFDSYLNRKHIAMGFEVRLGPALLQIAQDQAESFNNASQSLSLIFDKL